MTWNNPMSSYLDTVLYNKIWSRALQQSVANPRAATAVKVAPKAPFTATDFKPVQPRSVAQALVAASKGLTKEQGLALVDGLNTGLDLFEKEARKNNVAYAIAFLLAISMQTLNDKEVSDAESEALAQAVNDELAAAASFKKIAAKQKQLLYETSIVVGALIGGMAASATESSDAELKQRAKDMARQALQTFQGK
jgi:hypothetical protein